MVASTTNIAIFVIYCSGVQVSSVDEFVSGEKRVTVSLRGAQCGVHTCGSASGMKCYRHLQHDMSNIIVGNSRLKILDNFTGSR